MDTIESYIALNNPSATARALKEMGAPSIKVGDHTTLLKRVHEATKKYGITAFEKLAQIDTPYRSLIMSQQSEAKSNCGGYSNCGGGCSNTVGDEPVKIETKNDEPKKAFGNERLLVAGVVLLGVIAVVMISK